MITPSTAAALLDDATCVFMYCRANVIFNAGDAAAPLVDVVVIVCGIASLVTLRVLALMTMAQVDPIVSQILACDGYFTSQQNLVSTEVLQASMNSMAQSIAGQVRMLPVLSVSDAARMNNAVQNTTSFRLEQKTIVATAINTKVTQTTPASSTKRGQQTLADTRAYFTANDWAVFEDPTISLSQKLTVCCDRLMLLGVRNPAESTIKAAAAPLALAHSPEASADELYGLVAQLKMGIHARRQSHNPNLLHVATYPPTPAGLAQELYQSAYSIEAPITKTLHGYVTMMGKIPLRNTNKSLQTHAGRVAPNLPSPVDGLNPVAQLLEIIC